MACLTWAIYIAFVATISALRIQNEVGLDLGEAPYVFTSHNFPNEAPGNLIQEWHFTTSEGSAVRVVCPDFRIRQRSDTGCGDEKVTFVYEETREVCGFKPVFTVLSSSNSMTVTYTTGTFGYGVFRCEAQVVHAPRQRRQANLAVPSEEVDSAEHGGPAGAKTTNCSCGWANKEQKRIVNGRETLREEYPFMVHLVTTKSKSPICGGTIITSRHVLTAAHCSDDYVKKPADLSVVARKHKTWSDTRGDAYVVEKIFEHELYNTVWGKHDISIILVKGQIKFDQSVGPVCLSPTRPNISGQYVKILGWGSVSTTGPNPQALQKVNIRVVPIALCHAVHPTTVDHINPTQMCTFSKTKSICYGDSGGPALWVDPETNRYTQVGIMSFISKYCSGSKPNVYTDVPAYHDWIQRIVSESGSHKTCNKIN